MREEEYKQKIMDAITDLRHLFKLKPHIFLTEDDVRCVLYQLLISRIGFWVREDSQVMSPVHAEVRWYGKNQNLHKRSDLVVLDASDIRVEGRSFPLPSKGFGFNNFYAAIEIKLRRQTGDCDRVWLDKLKKDTDTLLSLRNEVSNAYNPLLVLVAFDRKSSIKDMVEQTCSGVDVAYESLAAEAV